MWKTNHRKRGVRGGDGVARLSGHKKTFNVYDVVCVLTETKNCQWREGGREGWREGGREGMKERRRIHS